MILFIYTLFRIIDVESFNRLFMLINLCSLLTSTPHRDPTSPCSYSSFLFLFFCVVLSPIAEVLHFNSSLGAPLFSRPVLRADAAPVRSTSTVSTLPLRVLTTFSRSRVEYTPPRRDELLRLEGMFAKIYAA